MTQEQAIEAIKTLPQKFEIDELIEKFEFMAQIEQGLAQIELGHKIPHDEVKRMAKEWQK